jgi:hypothetical protein
MGPQENFSSPNPGMPSATHECIGKPRAPRNAEGQSDSEQQDCIRVYKYFFLNSRKFQIVSQYSIKPRVMHLVVSCSPYQWKWQEM